MRRDAAAKHVEGWWWGGVWVLECCWWCMCELALTNTGQGTDNSRTTLTPLALLLFIKLQSHLSWVPVVRASCLACGATYENVYVSATLSRCTLG
jgi:hypothetical protein